MSFSIPFVLLPIFGFRACSLPQVTMDIQSIKEGNYEYPRKIIKGASVGAVTLEQGVQLVNTDFWDWIRKAVVGRLPPKNILIVQFTRMAIGDGTAVTATDGDSSKFGQAVMGNFEFALRVPGRAWLLKDCRPAGYKPGSDFDAQSSDISIATLDLEPEEIEEFGLGI